MPQIGKWANLDGLGLSYGRYAEPSMNSLGITPHETLILSHPCIILAGTLWPISSQFSVVKPAFRFLSRPALTTDSSTGSETQTRYFGHFGRFWSDLAPLALSSHSLYWRASFGCFDSFLILTSLFLESLVLKSWRSLSRSPGWSWNLSTNTKILEYHTRIIYSTRVSPIMLASSGVD